MLYTIAVVLLVLWILGFATSVTAGGLLHVLLVHRRHHGGVPVDHRPSRGLSARILSLRHDGDSKMMLCPIALAVGCKKCPAFVICPVKGIIGDYKKPDDAAKAPPAK